MHYWGASAMIAFMLMHLLQGLLWGAYKKPRELQWIVGVLLFIMTLVLGLTGYLLPWDLNALLASRVAINISGNAPVLGQAVLQFLQDGNGIGTLTISRFFGIHVWLVPALLLGLVGMHLAIFRWNGPAGPPIDEAPKLKPGRFWPEQLFMDTVLSFAMFALIVVLSWIAPAPLDAKADPNVEQFVPYPAWYFLALYALLDIVGKFPAANHAARDALRDDRRADAARRAAAGPAVRRQESVAPPVAASVGPRRSPRSSWSARSR